MTLLKPTLLVTRLVIKRSQHVVFDEKFHAGVNIIRGENGSGKTTIVESIIFALGGDIKKKKDEFGLCDFVYAELQINGENYTFKRPIEEGYPALDIFEGTYDEAKNSPDLWTRYGHRRTNNQKSYSEVIFSLLGLP
jgi:DNA repair exonuclease SbcCD ATPase subunit